MKMSERKQAREAQVKRLTVTFAVALLAAGMGAPAGAQQYPERAIKMIVPWAAGGDTDNIFRPIAPLLQKHLGQARVTIAKPKVLGRSVRPSALRSDPVYRSDAGFRVARTLD
jgi:hypothetical protein